MKHWMGNMLILTLWLECSGEDTVIQSTGDVFSTEGHTVTLDCTFEISGSINAYLFWYKQVNNHLTYILRRDTFNTEDNSPEFQKDRFDATISKTSVPLNISSAAVSDSAVYYCAVRTGSSQKIIFGTGTSLTVEPKSVSKPSFYKLSGGDTEACLASGFSRIKAATDQQLELFKHSAAVRVGGESLYNQLVLLTTEKDREACEQAEEDSDVCGEPVEPDGRVNMMSVTMLGLRLLFFKTVVFNVLMTLRLWISQ